MATKFMLYNYSHFLHIIGTTEQSSARNGHKIDTNVLVVKFSCLSEPKPVHTGDPVVCSNHGCTTVLNHLSHITEDRSKKVTIFQATLI